MLPELTAIRYVTPLKEGGSPARHRRGRRRRHLRPEVPRRRTGAQGPRGRGARRRDRPAASTCPCPISPSSTSTRASRSTRPTRRCRTCSRRRSAPTSASTSCPGSLGYDGSRPPDADLAERIIWLDALTANVDRTWSNPNLLVWHGRTWAIDHGAALYFHHSWPSRAPDPERFAAQPFDASRHVLRDVAGDVGRTTRRARRRGSRPRPSRPSSPTCPTSGSSRRPTSRTRLRCERHTAAMLRARLEGPLAWLPTGVAA